MPSRQTSVSLLIIMMLLFSCQNEHPGASQRGLPVHEKKVEKPAYDTMLRALERLQQDPALRNASIGYLVVDVTTREPVIVAGHNAKQMMVPASTLKIFVTGAALELIGKPALREVVITNQMSVNWRSSKLLRKIGGNVYNTATTAAGTRALLDFWSAKGVDTTGMVLYDGNGLSHSNAVSPKQLVEALYAMRTSPYYQLFYESLPLAGFSGTLHRAMKGTAAEGRLRAKTGTIGRVKSFAGYITTVTGRRLIFSLIVNDYECRVKLVKKKMEEVMIRMAEV